MRFKTIYDTYKVKDGVKFSEPTMTVQSEKDNCDINVIMNRYATCGTPLPVRQDGLQPVYADVSDLGDYMENFNKCKQAEDMFNKLPSALRKELDNNPANLLPFIQDDANKERCYEYGLLNRPSVEVSEASTSIDDSSVVSSSSSIPIATPAQ